MGQRVARALCYRAPKRRFRADPIALVLGFDVTERRVRFTEIGREAQSLVDGASCAGKDLVRRLDREYAEHGVRVGDADVREREARVPLDRSREVLERLPEPLLVVALAVESAVD